MNLDRIRPKLNGKSDKYSWNLYKFLRKIANENNNIHNSLKIYWNHHSRWDGKHLPFNKNLSERLQIIIDPYDNKGSGYFMNTVLQKGTCDLFSLYAWRKEDLLDITDWFFNEYEKIGRCIFDPEHNGWLLGAEERYTYVNNTRKCNWCGQWQHKEIVKKVKIERTPVWSKEKTKK